MDWFQFILEIFKFTIPALVVFLVTHLTIKNFLDNDYQKKVLQLKKKGNAAVVPLKMQAYERLIIYMERINPSILLVRLTTSNMSALQLKNELLHTINEEYNHNVAQQLYVSPQAWRMIRVVREQLQHIINESYASLESNAKGVDLGKRILEVIIDTDEIPTDKAIDFLKKEFKLMFD